MDKRRFGRTGHMSTVAILGSYAFSEADQAVTDEVMAKVMQYGVNHIDVAPSYGDAELRLAPWLRQHRDKFFLGCKTRERTKQGAQAELHRSMVRLQVDYFDLYQLHAIKNIEDLDQVTAPGGALEALVDARAEGLINFIGITGHRFPIPAVLIEALQRFDFDSVLFPLNFIQLANPTYRQNTQKLLQLCREKNVGVMIIKSIAKGHFLKQPADYHTFYEPFTETEQIQKAVNFVLSQDVTGICTVGDMRLLPPVLEACQNFTPLTLGEHDAMIKEGEKYELLFPVS